MENKAGHVGFRILVIICAWTFLIVDIIFRSLAINGKSIIFSNTTEVKNAIYQTEVTPAPFTYQIWIILYVLQALFLSYAFATILRPSGPGYLYTTPNYLPPIIYLTYSVSLLTSIVWTFLWDQGQIVAALVFRILSLVFAFISLGVAMAGLFRNYKLLVSYGHRYEYIWVLIFVINPLGAYAVWLSIETFVNLSAVFVYSLDVSQNAAGSASLVILTALLVFYSLCDLAFFERYFRFLYTAWLVLIWAYAGILVENLDWMTSNTVFTLGLIIITSIILILKVFLSIIRAFSKPLFDDAAMMTTPPMMMSDPTTLGGGNTTIATTPALGLSTTPASYLTPAPGPPAAFNGYPALAPL